MDMGKIVNIRRFDEIVTSINRWYMEHGILGVVSEAEVNNISIRYLDRKTGEPTKGKTKPETILWQLTTKKGQFLSTFRRMALRSTIELHQAEFFGNLFFFSFEYITCIMEKGMSTLYQQWELWKMSALPPSLVEVRDEIEQLLDDDGDMAEMYLTEKKERSEAFTLENLGNHETLFAVNSKTAPVSPVGPVNGLQKLQRAFSTNMCSRHGILSSSSSGEENIEQLEMSLEAYFVLIDQYHTLSKVFRIRVSRNLESGDIFMIQSVKELELEVYPVVVELASTVSTRNLERVRRLKGQLLTMTRRVQKIEQLMDDDGDMVEMYLTEKKERSKAFTLENLGNHGSLFAVNSKSAHVSLVGAVNGLQKLQEHLELLWVQDMEAYEVRLAVRKILNN
ncbi:hypothetical protein ACFE04_013761 [Oxalis oulophora]